MSLENSSRALSPSDTASLGETPVSPILGNATYAENTSTTTIIITSLHHEAENAVNNNVVKTDKIDLNDEHAANATHDVNASQNVPASNQDAKLHINSAAHQEAVPHEGTTTHHFTIPSLKNSITTTTAPTRAISADNVRISTTTTTSTTEPQITIVQPHRRSASLSLGPQPLSVSTTTPHTASSLPPTPSITLNDYLQSIPHSISVKSRIRYLKTKVAQALTGHHDESHIDVPLNEHGERFPKHAIQLCALYWKLNKYEDAMRLIQSLTEKFPKSAMRYEALCCTLMAHYQYVDFVATNSALHHASGVVVPHGSTHAKSISSTNGGASLMANQHSRQRYLQLALNYYTSHILINEFHTDTTDHDYQNASFTVRNSVTFNEKFEALFCFLKARKFTVVRALIKNLMQHWVHENKLLREPQGAPPADALDSSQSSVQQNVDYEQQRTVWLLTMLLLTTTSSLSTASLDNLLEAKSIVNRLRKLDQHDVLYMLLSIKISEAIRGKQHEKENLMQMALLQSESPASLRESGLSAKSTTTDEPSPYLNWSEVKFANSYPTSNAPSDTDGTFLKLSLSDANHNKNVIKYLTVCTEKLLDNFRRHDQYMQRNWRWCTIEIFNMLLRYRAYEKATSFVQDVSGFVSTADLLYFKGRLEQHKSQMDTARQHYDQCLYLQNEHVESNLDAAQLCFEMEDYLSARSFVLQAIKYSAGTNVQAHLLMGKILKELSLYEQAAKHLSICVQHDQAVPIVDFDSFLFDSFLDALVVEP